MNPYDDIRGARQLEDCLTKFVAPAVTSEMTEKLLDKARPFLPRPVQLRFKEQLRASVPKSDNFDDATVSLLRAMKSQVSIFTLPYWLVTSVIIALGILLSSTAGGRLVTHIMLASPVLSAVSVAYAFRSIGHGPGELEMSCPVTPAQLVAGRMTIVLTYNVVMGLALTLAMTMTLTAGGLAAGLGDFTDVVNGRFVSTVLSWLMPLLLLSAISLHLSVTKGSLPATVVSAGLWGTHVAMSDTWHILTVLTDPLVYNSLSLRLAITCIALLMLVMALVKGIRETERAGVWTVSHR